MKTLLLSIVLLCATYSITVAQTTINEVLIEVESNSTTLKALQQQMEAQKLFNRTDIYLSNPEVEFGYLWGSPAITGNRIDISVKQSFDFPTVYSHKNKLANLENTNIQWTYKAQRIELLLSVKQICIHLTYYNALIQEYKTRWNNAQTIAQTINKSMEAGDANILEVNKAQLNLVTVQNQITIIKTEQQRLLSELKRHNGNKEIIFTDTLFESITIPTNFEQWYATAETNSPALQYLKGTIEADKRRIQINQAARLPKFSVGYASESVVGTQYHGVTVGISVPLWENKNKVKHAKAQVVASQMTAEDTQITFYNNLQYLFNKATTLQNADSLYTTSLQTNNNDNLLKKAWQIGNITLINYLLESQYYYNVLESKLAIQRDLSLTIAQLECVHW